MTDRPRRRPPVAGGQLQSTEKKPRTLLGKRYRTQRELGGMGSLGLEIALSIVLPLLLGSWLDKRWETGPWMSVVGFVLGLATAARTVVRAMRAMKKVAEKEEAEMGNPAPLYPDEESRQDQGEENWRRDSEDEPGAEDEDGTK